MPPQNVDVTRLARFSLCFGLGLVACGDAGPKARPSATAAPSGAPVVIELGPNGATRVEGVELQGDAKTCAAMKACCAASSDVGLFCGLAQATDGASCAKVLASTQQYMAERKITRPAGCP